MKSPNVLIRNEKETDHKVISDVTQAAFATLEISNHTEQFIIETLRVANALTISLVAEIENHVVGHIAFSPVTISGSDGATAWYGVNPVSVLPGWYGLGPVSVHPDFQRQGIGKALIQEGLSRLRALQAKGCCLVGHPEYYRQFGFKNVEGLGHEGVPKEFIFALSFDSDIPQGNVIFHEGFKATGPQVATASI